MNKLTPKITIDGETAIFLKGALTSTGGLRAASLQFTLPLKYAVEKNLWNKEVLFYLDEKNSSPLFRGYVKRIKETLNEIEVIAQDSIGYLVLGGSADQAIISLTDKENLDGLTVGNAIRKAISMANLSSKIGTDYIGDTTPLISSSRPPLRGTMSVLDIIKELISRAVDDSGTLPRPNIAKLIDDGSKSQLVIELESDLENGEVIQKFSEEENILAIKIINKKIPTVIVVNGKNAVKGKYTHTSALEAYDANYLEVTNEALESPAACKDFAQKIFRANLQTQYEYGIDTVDGYYLNENDIIHIKTNEKEYSGNYRVRGKKLAFTTGGFTVGLNINRKPPSLAEYIKQQDN